MNNKWLRGALPAILIHISIGSVYAWSMLVSAISTYIGSPQSKVQFAFSLAIFFLGMSAAFGGKFVERNIKKSSLVSCGFFVSGLFITALAIHFKSLLLLYLGYGCVLGIGLGVGYITPVKSLMLWFKDNKGLATGIAVCAFGFASTIASPLITFLTSHYSLEGSFIRLGFIYLIPMLIAHLIIKKPDWYKEEIHPDFDVAATIKEKSFILIWLIMFLNITCGLALISIANPLLKEQGLGLKFITIIVSIMGIFNGAGRLVFSAVSDKLKDRTNIYRVILLLGLYFAIAAATFKTSTMTGITLCVVSACYGAGFSCLPTLLSDIYGMDNISKIHGLALTAWSMAGLCGNQLSSLVKKISGGYEDVLLVLFFIYFVGYLIVYRLKMNVIKSQVLKY